MEKIVALHRNHYGHIISFQTTTGRIISYQKTIQEVQNGLIDGVHLNSNEQGETILTPTNFHSFDELPQIY